MVRTTRQNYHFFDVALNVSHFIEALKYVYSIASIFVVQESVLSAVSEVAIAFQNITLTDDKFTMPQQEEILNAGK